MHVQRNNEARPCSHCCSGKERSSTYFECVSVPLVMQHAMRMRRIVICLALLYFSTYPTTPLCGLSPRANYTDRAAAAGRRS